LDIDMKALKIASVAIALVAIILALPLLLGLPMGVFASAIQDRVERETGYRLDIAGPASLNIWPSLNATLADVTLHDPRDHDGNTRLTISRIRAEVSASSLLSGRPRISHLVVENPVLHLPLLRERGRDIPPHSSATARNGNDSPLLIDRLTVRDGAVILSNPRDRVEERVDGIGADAVTSPDNKLMVTGSARMGEHPLKFDIKADAPSLSQRQSIPVEFNIDMPNALRAPLSGHAELRLNG
jgi:AsmA protein